jgi:outer membrane protein OmpU
MKKLLASTALLAFVAGAASADVTTTGTARMGIIDTFGDTGAQFSSRVRIIFTASGESDSGLAFGATVRNDQSGVGNTANGDSVVYVSGTFGKLSMGDVDGAASAAMGQADGVGFTGLSDLNEIDFLGNAGAAPKLFDAQSPTADPISGDTSVLYEYTSGALGLYASMNQRGYTFNGFSNDASYAVAASYTVNAYKFALGYERNDISLPGTEWNIKQISLGADATFGAVVLKARYATGDVAGTNGYTQDIKQWAVSGTYTANALALTAFLSDQEFNRTGTIFERKAYGLGASYDLGGGASVAGGYVRNQTDDTSAVDLGLKFAF